jgi:hypothetical protein
VDEIKTRNEIDQQTLDCYYDYIVCDLDLNSSFWEEDVQLDQMDEDITDNIDMLPIPIT